MLKRSIFPDSTFTSAFSIQHSALRLIALVAREGFEPSKPLGRQIYSLLRLTASLPRRYPPADAPGLTLCSSSLSVGCIRDSRRVRLQCRPWFLSSVLGFRSSLGSRPRQETWSWRRDLNPRPADYKSAALLD